MREEVDDLEFLPRFFSLEEKCLCATPILYLEVAQIHSAGLKYTIFDDQCHLHYTENSYKWHALQMAVLTKWQLKPISFKT